jgi:hypothetical protein
MCIVLGPPAILDVSPKDDMTIENGSAAHYSLTVFDAAGNPTGDGRQIVNAWVRILSLLFNLNPNPSFNPSPPWLTVSAILKVSAGRLSMPG